MSDLVPAREPGSDLVFVGSYGSAAGQRIHAVVIDETGTMRIVGGADGIADPSFLAVHPDGHTLYAVSETGSVADGSVGHVHALRIEEFAQTVGLTPMGARSTHGDHPCHLSIDRTGRWLHATNYSSGEVVVFRIDGDGSLSEAVERIDHVGRGPHEERQLGPHPHSTTVSPDNEYLIVADLGVDRVFIYGRDDDTGSLEYHGDMRSRPGSGPRSSTFDPSGRFLCVVNELDNTVTLYAWDRGSGTLEEIQVTPTLPDGVDTPNLAADVCFDPSGRSLYVSNRGHDSVMAYRLDPERGLTTIGTQPSGGMSPRAIVVAPSGSHLVVANERSDRVVSLPLVGMDASHAEVPSTLEVEHPSIVVWT